MRVAVAYIGAVALHTAAAIGLNALGGARSTGHEGSSQEVLVEVEQVTTTAQPLRNEAVVPPPIPPSSMVATHHFLDERTESHDTHAVVPTTTATNAPTGPRRFAMFASPAEPALTASSEVVSESDVGVRARRVTGQLPAYPADALAQGIELTAPLTFEIVVDVMGRVEETRALSHAGNGFDEAALAALKTFRFTPALRDGRPVRVRMRWSIEFRLN